MTVRSQNRQPNLVILPKKYAEDFKKFAERNPKPCPILEIMDGSPLVHDMGEGANIVTDIPRYFIYKNGVKVDEVTDASEYWQDDWFSYRLQLFLRGGALTGRN